MTEKNASPPRNPFSGHFERKGRTSTCLKCGATFEGESESDSDWIEDQPCDECGAEPMEAW
jgi:hypothetical protein